MELGWPQIKTNIAFRELQTTRISEVGHRGLVKITQWWSQDPDILGLSIAGFILPCCGSEIVLVEVGEDCEEDLVVELRASAGTAGSHMCTPLSLFLRTDFAYWEKMGEPSQGDLEPFVGYLWIQMTPVSFSLRQS